MKLSYQAMGAVMLALQNSIMEQSDIVPVLKDFNFETSEDGELLVSNPPTAKIPEEYIPQYEVDKKDRLQWKKKESDEEFDERFRGMTKKKEDDFRDEWGLEKEQGEV